MKVGPLLAGGRRKSVKSKLVRSLDLRLGEINIPFRVGRNAVQMAPLPREVPQVSESPEQLKRLAIKDPGMSVGTTRNTHVLLLGIP